MEEVISYSKIKKSNFFLGTLEGKKWDGLYDLPLGLGMQVSAGVDSFSHCFLQFTKHYQLLHLSDAPKELSALFKATLL